MHIGVKLLTCLVVILFASFAAPQQDHFKSSYSRERDTEDTSIPLPPSNREINQALDTASEYLESAKELGSQTISTEAQREKEKIVEDLQDVLESARDLLEKKNKGDLLQRFILHSGQALKQAATEAVPNAKDRFTDDLSHISSQIESELVKRKANRILRLSRSLIFQLLRSDEFRSLVNDFFSWINDGLLSPIIEKGKETMYNVADVGIDAAQRAVDTGKESIEKLSDTVKTGKLYDKGAEAAKKAYETYDEISTAAEKIKDTGIEAAQDIKERIVASLTDPARRKQVINEFSVLWKKLARDEKLKEGIKQLLELMDLLKEETVKFTQRLQQSTKEAVEVGVDSVETELIYKSLNEAKQLLNQLIGVDPKQTSPLEELIDGLRDMFDLVNQDENTRGFFGDAKNFLLKSLEKPELLVGVAEEELGVPGKTVTKETQLAAHHHKADGEQLLERANDVFSTIRYGRPTRKLLHSWKKLDYLVRNDPTGNRFTRSLKRLLKDVALDISSEGSVSFGLATLTRMKEWLIPMITDSFANISLPSISGSTDAYDYVLEGLKLSNALIKPENVHIHTTEDVDLNTEHIALEKIHAQVTLQINNIKTSIHGARFGFRRKTFPRLSDEGIVDLDLAGDGTSLLIDMDAVYHSDKPTEFTVKNIKCNVDKLSINVVEARHKWLYNVIRMLFSSSIKNRFEDAVEGSLWATINELGSNWQKFAGITEETIDALKKPQEAFKCVVGEVVDEAKKLAGMA